MKQFTVFDIGAHKGNWSKEYVRYYPNSIFFLFEPNNIFNEDLSKLGKVFNVVLSDRVREVDFFSINGTGDSYVRENSPLYEKIAPLKKVSVTLDELVVSAKIPAPDIIKIDTQGSEMDILKGGLNSIKNCVLLIIELRLTTTQDSNRSSLSNVVKYLHDVGWYPFGILESHIDKAGEIREIDFAFRKRV